MFVLPPLPYPAESLEPVIDVATMLLHHDKHHQTYVDKLNEAVAADRLENKTIEQLLEKVSTLSTAVRNNGGGHYNHSLFWTLLTKPGTGSAPDSDLLSAISNSFGSLDEMKTQFATAGLNRFGSGWVWLVTDGAGQLRLGSLPNQDNPLMDLAEIKGKPILALDVWEHAYYLKYQNKRADYITAFWQVVNWSRVSELFHQASSASS